MRFGNAGLFLAEGGQRLRSRRISATSLASVLGVRRRLVQRWAEKRQIERNYIQPGKPQQNTRVEHFDRMVRDEGLSQHLWEDLDEGQLFATQWMDDCNHRRPNMALDGITAKQRLAIAA